MAAPIKGCCFFTTKGNFWLCRCQRLLIELEGAKLEHQIQPEEGKTQEADGHQQRGCPMRKPNNGIQFFALLANFGWHLL